VIPYPAPTMPMGNHPCPCGKIFPSAGFHTGQSPRGSRLRIQIDTPSFTISSHSCWGLDDEALSGTTVGVASLVGIQGNIAS